MPEITPAAACKLCGGPVSKRNTSGFCHQTPACKRESLRSSSRKFKAAHKEEAAAHWAAYGPSYKDRRAELDRDRLQDLGIRARRAAAVQVFKTDPANAERVREYNRRGRQKYMARADRSCLFSSGCAVYARVGSKFCTEHNRAEAAYFYRRTAEARRQAMAEAQNWICPWCSDYLPSSLARTHVDHIIPRASGLVIEEDWNFQLLHGRCNQVKSERVTPQAAALAAEHGLVLRVPDSMPQ